MKVSPLTPPMSTAEQEEDAVPHHDNHNFDSENKCLKRRRLHSQTNIMVNGNVYRHRKHRYQRHDDKSPSADCFDEDAIGESVNGNSNSNNSNNNSDGEEASDRDDAPMTPSSRPPTQQRPEEETSSPSLHHHHDKNKVRYL